MTVLNEADAVMLDDQPVDAVYLGADKVWPPEIAGLLDPVIVQQKGFFFTSRLSATPVLDAPTQPGSTILAFGSTSAGSGQQLSIPTDPAGNTWTRLADQGISAQASSHGFVYMAEDAASISEVTLALTGATNRVWNVILVELQDVGALGAAGVVGTSEAGGQPTYTTVDLVAIVGGYTSQEADIVFAMTATGIRDFTLLTPEWTMLGDPPVGASTDLHGAFLVQDEAGGPIGPTWTMSSAGRVTAIMFGLRRVAA